MFADQKMNKASRSAASRMNLSLSRVSLGLALAFGAAAGAQAQSLQELYEAARVYDASYLASRAQAESAQYKAEQAYALRRPSLGLGVNAAHSDYRLPYDNLRHATEGTTQAGLTAKYSVYNRGNSLSIEQAERSLGSARADMEIAEQDLIVRVAQAYFNVLAAQDVLNTTRASKVAIAEQLASAKRNFEVGTATITDTREAQARYDLSGAQELAADNDLRIKRVTLDTIVGRAGVEPRPLALPVALPGLASTSPEAWVSEADTSHPAVRKARLGLEVAELETGKARAANGTTVDLTGTLGRQHQRGTAADIPGTSDSATVTLSIALPLYTGGANSNRIKETLALEEKARNDLDYARRSVSEATRSALLGVQSLQAQVRAYEAAESSSKLALEATQLGYKVGVRVNLDVLNAQTQLYTTQRDLAKARYDLVLTGLKLRQAAGQLRPEDVAAINQLLAK
jgi:outer membrane protein